MFTKLYVFSLIIYIFWLMRILCKIDHFLNYQSEWSAPLNFSYCVTVRWVTSFRWKHNRLNTAGMLWNNEILLSLIKTHTYNELGIIINKKNIFNQYAVTIIFGALCILTVPSSDMSITQKFLTNQIADDDIIIVMSHTLG